MCVCVLYIYIYTIFSALEQTSLLSLYIGHFYIQQLNTYPLVPYIGHTVRSDPTFVYIETIFTHNKPNTFLFYVLSTVNNTSNTYTKSLSVCIGYFCTHETE